MTMVLKCSNLWEFFVVVFFWWISDGITRLVRLQLVRSLVNSKNAILRVGPRPHSFVSATEFHVIFIARNRRPTIIPNVPSDNRLVDTCISTPWECVCFFSMEKWRYKLQNRIFIRIKWLEWFECVEFHLISIEISGIQVTFGVFFQ